jgi:glucose/arabinose dehydrogenase
MKTKLLFASLLFTALAPAQEIELEQFATGFTNPIEIVHAGDSRLFVVEQGGIIRILNADGSVNPNPFLNISNLVSTGSEQGLLGLAFHPDYDDNGYFYVNYTNTAGHTVVARYSVNPTDPSLADATSQLPLLTINQPYENHNGGCLRFGPDGYLYIATGDGGSGGDPENRAQNLETLLGKILRIDVDNGNPYVVPATNPFMGVGGADEIWAYGLRNPWKFSFNRNNGDLWIADVGQNAVEEINKVVSNPGGLNYGWRCYEGNR